MYGYAVPTIAVDVHVGVCVKRIGIVPANADVEEIRKRLEKLVPEKLRYIINNGFVEFGKEICRTRNPKCEICKIREICSFKK